MVYGNNVPAFGLGGRFGVWDIVTGNRITSLGIIGGPKRVKITESFIISAAGSPVYYAGFEAPENIRDDVKRYSDEICERAANSSKTASSDVEVLERVPGGRRRRRNKYEKGHESGNVTEIKSALEDMKEELKRTNLEREKEKKEMGKIKSQVEKQKTVMNKMRLELEVLKVAVVKTNRA